MYEDLKRGWRYYLETFPCVYLRLIRCGIAALALLIIVGLAMVMGGYGLAMIGFVLSIGLYGFFFRPLILSAEAAHRAVIMALMKGERVPAGKRQLYFGKKRTRTFEWHETGVNIENASLNELTLLLCLLGWGTGAGFFISFVPPVTGLMSLVPHLSFYFYLTAAAAAWVLKAGFVDAYVLAVIMGTYH